jgi:hypothetical protein
MHRHRVGGHTLGDRYGQWFPQGEDAAEQVAFGHVADDPTVVDYGQVPETERAHRRVEVIERRVALQRDDVAPHNLAREPWRLPQHLGLPRAPGAARARARNTRRASRARVSSVAVKPSRRDLLRAASSLGAGWIIGCESTPEPAPARVEAARRTDRRVVRVVGGTRSRDGAGVALTRMLGGAALPMLDPFLMLDVIRSERPEDYERGFPKHPHRGFETVTYMIEGAMKHEDSRGNRGLLTSGSAQWMTAGRGIVHSEMPQQTSGLLFGLQLWVNLPAAQKMMAPRYQDVAKETIPEADLGTSRVRRFLATGTWASASAAHRNMMRR